MNAVAEEGCNPIAVAPTGSGKTAIMCGFIDEYITKNPMHNILVLSHVKEILQQDEEAITEYFDGFPIGIYSAGLREKSIKKITVAGIQSAWRKPELFSGFDVVLIDECHRINTKQIGMYRKLLKSIGGEEDNVTAVGLTATPFRLGHGFIHKGDNALFNKIAHDLSSTENFNKLVDDGFLTKLIARNTDEDMQSKLRRIKVRAGDYSIEELSTTFDREPITERICKEIIQYGKNYKKWLIFAIDIAHAEHVTETLVKMGIEADYVHSKMEGDREEVIHAFRVGSIQAIVNVDVLTTGFDVPSIDLIAMLRPTHSASLHVQMLGRGMRTAEDKDHCLVLDFAGNTERLGPINDVVVRSKKATTGVVGGAPVKTCPVCRTYCHTSAKECPSCGHIFEFLSHLRDRASDAEVMAKTQKFEWHDVQSVFYYRHEKYGSPDSMKVVYSCGLKTVTEYICFDHTGYAGRKAANWVHFRMPRFTNLPTDVPELLSIARTLAQPKQIYCNIHGKYPEIKDAKFE